jgi:phage recombination protein Bet
MAPASARVPVEIDTADGQHYTVSFDDVKNFICPDATDAECKIFLETCRTYHLNPFTKEAYLIHYDNKNADTASTIVLGKNCYMQLAERHPKYDGFEAGLILTDEATGETYDREGTIVYDGEKLLGGWARVYRSDRTRPTYEAVKLTEYNTGKSLWASKPGTMIRKVALVHALREAFPSTYGTMYDESEMRIDAEATAREIDDVDMNAGAANSPYTRRLPRRAKATSADAKPAVELVSAPAAQPDESGAQSAPEDDVFGGDPV